MRELSIAFVLSIWPMRCTAGHSFNGETHEWWAAFGPVGAKLFFEPR